MGEELAEGFMADAGQLQMSMQTMSDEDCSELVNKINVFLDRVSPQ